MQFKMKCCFFAVSSLLIGAFPAQAFYLDGNGHYSLRAETRTFPEFQKDRGSSYQAVTQSFDLHGEMRMNDRASFKFRLGLFEDPRTAYWGDKAQPEDCDARQTYKNDNGTYTRDDSPSQCEGAYQDSGSPRYQKIVPFIREAYARYAFDFCIVEAGRRGRDFGLGLLNDSGKRPFDMDASVYDGISCDVNQQKSQIIGFAAGFDKLQETGYYTDQQLRVIKTKQPRGKGAMSSQDDLDQIFFKISYDDTKANAGSSFTREISIYFANAFGEASKTDLKYLDIFAGLNLGDFSWKNEIVLRLGRSADPNWVFSGGNGTEDPDDLSQATNKLESAGLAGKFEWTMSKSGSYVGPIEYNQGNFKRHVLFLEYAYAPGDEGGYYKDQSFMNADTKNAIGERARDRKATGMSFHRNYKPALLLFNGPPSTDDLRVDGIYNPGRFTNATLFGLGYRYESIETGSFEVKALTANLNRTIPGDVKAYYSSVFSTNPTDAEMERQYKLHKPIGYYGKELGYELDLKYTYTFGKEVELNTAGAVALPGRAYQTLDDAKPVMGYLIQTGASFKF